MIKEIVRKHGGYQLASDEGVFRFRTVDGCSTAMAEIARSMPTVGLYQTSDILVVTIHDRHDERSHRETRDSTPDPEVAGVVPNTVWDHTRPGRSVRALSA